MKERFFPQATITATPFLTTGPSVENLGIVSVPKRSHPATARIATTNTGATSTRNALGPSSANP
jgi:hypothetical protein